jgi:hypothetical protein
MFASIITLDPPCTRKQRRIQQWVGGGGAPAPYHLGSHNKFSIEILRKKEKEEKEEEGELPYNSILYSPLRVRDTFLM